ncbi:putative polyketide synthase [Xylaria flabelliformis]|nr:putative polyketide synthase [Xylaria flabelliformis]
MPGDIPIAVVGLAYRAPGVGRKGLWDYLAQARSAWTEIPTTRFDLSAYWKPGADKSGVFKAEGAHFIPGDIYAFDAAFFNMRAEEARNSDPQHRMLLECALEAAEDAGHSLLDLAGKKIGVFIGSGQSEYSQRLSDDPHSANTFTATGTAPCMAANRLSYFFDIDGPSITLDAACASSLYAAHQAVSALHNGDCDGAFLGAASLTISPGSWLALEKTGVLSAQGRSYSYDEKASGFGRGEGAACLLIKRMDDAIRDGDPIHAVIRGSACNHGGRSEGITMPNGVAHRKLLLAVHEAAGLDPSRTPVVEGHGTGTAAGDPIEAGAFTAVLAKNRTAENPIYIGSIKSNFGHLEGASGILGLVKAILMIKNGIVLPTAGFEKINPRIESKEKIRVLETPVPWPAGEARRVIVTNFGFGGSNSAMILEAPLGVDGGDSNGVNGINGVNGSSINPDSRLFVFSAKAEKSLTDYLSSFENYLDEAPESRDYAKNLSYTLGQRRTHNIYRASVVADSIANLQEKLSTIKPTRIKEQVIAMAFTGQGAQYPQMASGLRHYSAFATAMDEAEGHLQKMGAPWSLNEELAKPAPNSRVNDAEISQPACTAVQLALVMLLKSWGVVPMTVVGHSSGEIAAAFAAGLVSFRTAMAIAYFRGLAAALLTRQQSRKGAMLALGVGFEEATFLIDEHARGYATVAAINSPGSVTISGDESAIENVHRAADEKGLFARRLNVQLAYHSRHMDDVAAFYRAAIKPFCDEDVFHLKSRELSRSVFVSSVSGYVADPETIDDSYWVKNLVQPVKFLDAIRTVFASRQEVKTNVGKRLHSILIEIGPHSALKNPIKQTLEYQQNDRQKTPSFTYLSSLTRGIDGYENLLSLAGTLFTMGTPIELGSVNQTDMHNAHVVTGLPAYSWDKSISYEIRPRATQEKLYPGDSYHSLLGRRLNSNGGKDRAYRQVFTLDEMPWIRDHNVAGVVIFPLTGYMACAIEAVRRTLSTPAAAFVICDFHAVQRLEIQEEQVVDMVTKIKPAATGTGSVSSTIWTFEISTWTEAEAWTIHAHGQIAPEMTEMTADSLTLNGSLSLVDTTNLIEKALPYANESAGNRATIYGPTFKNAVRLFGGKGFTVLEHRLRDLGESQKLSSPYGSPVTVDPPTLDGFLQGGGPLQTTEDGRTPAQMPNYISRFRISNKIPTEPKQRIDVVTRLLDYDTKGGRMNISVAAFIRGNDGSFTPISEWESVSFRSIGMTEDDLDPASHLPDNWAWNKMSRFDFLPLEDLNKVIPAWDPSEADIVRDTTNKMTKAACYYINRALVETAQDDRSKLPFHLGRFINWANKNLPKYDIPSENESTALLEEVRSRNAQGELLCIIGENLVPILREEIEPLELMLAEGRLTKNYEADATNAHLSRVMGSLVANLCDLDPNLRILEIGGGTAGTTFPVLEALSRDGKEPSFLNFTFTDISTGFFENARTKLARWSQRITFQKLDISQDPAEQGFDIESFDVIIAANVLHATKDMTITMSHVRKLLTPRGKLFLLEAGSHPPFILPFFLLPGWWYAEDKYRNHEEGPMMPVHVWNRLLLDTGFSGVDVSLHDHVNSKHIVAGVICSTRIGKEEQNQTITICGPFLDDDEVEFAQTVADSISQHIGWPTELKPFAEIDPSDDPIYVFIDSSRHCLLEDVTMGVFEGVKKLLLRNTALLWVIPQGGRPESRSIKGMIRTVRLENEPKHLLTFDDVPFTSQGVSAIVKLTMILRDPEATRTEDQDFVWHEGSIHLPRMHLLNEVKEQFAVEGGLSFRKVQNIWSGDRALEMTVDAAGSADSIYFRRTDSNQEPVGEDEIIVKVNAAGVSYRDLNLILGSIPWASPGFDGAGKVVKKGSRVNTIGEGDIVFFLAPEGGAFSTYKKMPFWQAAKIPDGTTITDATSLSLAYSIAVLALLHNGRLTKDDTVLIHAAAGAVGQACVVLAQHVGARIFATASTQAKRNFLRETFGIPENQILSIHAPGFRDRILTETSGRGVDVIINSQSGEHLVESWTLCAKFGRFIEIGKKDASENGYLPMRPFDSNLSFISIDLPEFFKYRPRELEGVFSEVVRLIQRRVAIPIRPVTVLPISEFPAALRKLKSGENIGKIVVTLGAVENVLAETTLQPTQVTMKPNATYLITGGTRGIGLNLAYWMIDHGAHNIVLLGRSGSSGSEVQKLLKEYEGTDIRVRAMACDVGSREALANVLENIKDLPPVRGTIHGALQLNDKILENAVYDDWGTITRPRVQGAWNLHELLPSDLDFFILLGSFLGDTGNAGQSIYASTAAFFDALTQYRNARGQYTFNIALPVVLDVGYVASNNLSEVLKESLGATLTMADVRTIIKGIIMGPPSPFHRGNKAAAFRIFLDGQAIQNIPWTYFHPVHTKERLKAERRKRRKTGGGVLGPDMYSTSWTAAEDPLVGLTEALITKVSAMIMMDRDDVGSETPLSSYGLDSLVSVELRNWIRRETEVELPLSAITQAENLRSLAANIIAQREGAKGE